MPNDTTPRFTTFDETGRCDRLGADDGAHLSSDDPVSRPLIWVIRLAVRVLAVLMTGVIVFGVADVVYVLSKRLMAEPAGFLQISDILATFGAFMAVLIAIEIFINIVSYLRDDVIHVKLVMATALMAIARKVIVLDYTTTEALYVFATAAVLLAASVGYWLIATRTRDPR